MAVDAFTRGADENTELFLRDMDLRFASGYRRAFAPARVPATIFFDKTR
jgi:hypothetical protein